MEARVEKPHRIAGYCRISVDVEADRDNTSIENQNSLSEIENMTFVPLALFNEKFQILPSLRKS